MSDALRELLAKQAIAEQLYTYCRAFDRIDDELALGVWHRDGTVQYGDGGIQPIAEYLGGSSRIRRAFHNGSHQVTNVLIRVRGERAVSEAYVTASLQENPRDDGQMTEHLYRGRYVDRWSHRDGKWAIDHRQFVPDSYTSIRFPGDRVGTPFLSIARRDRQDPSYLAFDELESENANTNRE